MGDYYTLCMYNGLRNVRPWAITMHYASMYNVLHSICRWVITTHQSPIPQFWGHSRASAHGRLLSTLR